MELFVAPGFLQQASPLPSTAFAHFHRKEDQDCNLYYVFELCVNVLSYGVHCVVPPSLTVLTALAVVELSGFVASEKE